MDKAFWQSILDANGTVPSSHDLPALTEELLSYLGSTDPQLRDSFGWLLATLKPMNEI